MITFQRKNYTLVLNERSGTVDRLSGPGDPETVSLLHKEPESAFGSVSTTRKGAKWTLENTGSPIGIPSYVLREERCCALLEKQTEDSASFLNPATGLRIRYDMEENGFHILAEGAFPDADMVALDLNPAFADLRQNDRVTDQFTFQSFYTCEDRSLVYTWLERIGGGWGMLFHSTTPCCAWRCRYANSPYIPGMQFVFRFPEYLDLQSKAGTPFRMGVRVSFHRSLNEALIWLNRTEKIPVLTAPVTSDQVGKQLTFSCMDPKAELTLHTPSGEERTLTENSFLLKEEGFYRLTARNSAGKSYEMTLHGALPWLTVLERGRKHLNPYFRNPNAEASSWVRAMCLAHGWIGPDPRMNGYLHDALILWGMQGLPDIFPLPKPSAEESRQRLSVRPENREIIIRYDDQGLLIGAPSPVDHTENGQFFPAGHIHKYHRIQDGFSYVQEFLFASEAFHSDAFYEHAKKIAEAHLQAHLRPDGSLCKRSGNIDTDYTTVVSPLYSLAELYRECVRRKDPYADRLKEAMIRSADYLMKRGFEFPTEGVRVHLRWTEDGSISCTALSLLAVYCFAEKRPEYLKRAKEILDFHRSWRLVAPDARVNGSTWRFWETQWENEGEGHAVNAGHAWSLWRGTAQFLYGMSAGDGEAFLESWNAFQTNLCNHHPDGRSSSCFTPDYLPERPNREKLYHCYPDRPDDSLSWYIWEMLRNTWLDACVLLKRPEGTLVLNGEIQDGKLRSFAPFPARIFAPDGLPEGVILPESAGTLQPNF